MELFVHDYNTRCSQMLELRPKATGSIYHWRHDFSKWLTILGKFPNKVKYNLPSITLFLEN